MPESSSVPDALSVEQLLVMLAERDRVIAELSARVSELESRLAKNSQNSSKPPSSDAFVKPPPRSLRRRSGRGPGKAPGDPGSRLEPRSEPDQVLVHAPQWCSSCGEDLDGAPVVAEQARQVLDLPPIRLVATEHRAQKRVCRCGTVTSAQFPDQVRCPVSYGPRITALGCYLLGRQHLPVQRAAEAMADCFGAPVSTGWLASLMPTAARRLDEFTDAVRRQLQTAAVAHFDETGSRVATKTRWVHVACTEKLTLYHLDAKRGTPAIDAAGVLTNFAGTAVHDGFYSYRGYPVTHGLCNAHHLRELAGMAEATGQDWPTALADLLVEIYVASEKAKAVGKERLPARRLAGYRRRYQSLIEDGLRLNPAPPRTGKSGRPRLGAARSLLRRLDEYRDDVLRFATDFTVAFDNNQAERDIRMVKIQQKISGCWRSDHGADAFLTVRGYLSTARKQGHTALDVLTDLFAGSPWIPQPTGPAP